MIPSRIAQIFLYKTLGITAGLFSFLSYQSFVYSAPPSPDPIETLSKLNLAAIEDEKQIYPIAEKLIRANGLDDYPWRIKVEEEYHDNAYATNINQVAIFKRTRD
jgi:hypothetical protein